MTEPPTVQFVVEPADSPPSLELQSAFFADIAGRYPGWEPGASSRADPSDFTAPDGLWLVAYLDGRPAGCGGVQRVGEEKAEIRRVYLDAGARGRGLGRMLMTELEDHSRRLGYARVRLTTGDRQPEALGLFRSLGYDAVEPFSAGVFTRHWLEKPLG